jgi:hypothetical protein
VLGHRPVEHAREHLAAAVGRLGGPFPLVLLIGNERGNLRRRNQLERIACNDAC